MPCPHDGGTYEHNRGGALRWPGPWFLCFGFLTLDDKSGETDIRVFAVPLVASMGEYVRRACMYVYVCVGWGGEVGSTFVLVSFTFISI